MKKDTKRFKRKQRENFIQKRRSEWKKGAAVERLENPSKPERARELGYKSKQGVVMARARVRRGGRRKERPRKGRRPKRMGVNKITPTKNKQLIAEERTNRKFPNLEVLNSYKIGEDGEYHYYEVILADPNHPVVQNDPDLSWITNSSQKNRVNRGLTSAGKSARGLKNKGKGSEKNRPSRKSGRQ
ncbi:50S ribosomal protein L15e [candidate division MSBL1 archaeon SCGC-AAA259D18]|uniref:Large ribosomal subunit protein eL15 n=2 Tax=candidate division MSBL1 TaxID=215777 RepID=A0A133UB95_9EURY|nr:50S ribosomal protein L15e [candidate division MSBL1 archaeon SCGC-AAA259D18]KXA91472.1 50S ribosomal protein L15e [candidate division MSBL1 archaeon SCGC-AAA259A05]